MTKRKSILGWACIYQHPFNQRTVISETVSFKSEAEGMKAPAAYNGEKMVPYRREAIVPIYSHR